MNPSLLMPSEQSQKLVLLGVGQAALHVAKINSSYKLFGTTRNKQKLDILANALIEPICICSDLFDQSKDQLSELYKNILDKENLFKLGITDLDNIKYIHDIKKKFKLSKDKFTKFFFPATLSKK